MKSPEKNNYETTYEDCISWFNILNNELFNNELPKIDKIDIRWRRGCHAQYECYVGKRVKYCALHMNKKYKSKQFFVEVLAHELVHHYQYANGLELNHGESFLNWKTKFSKKGLCLEKGYN